MAGNGGGAYVKRDVPLVATDPGSLPTITFSDLLVGLESVAEQVPVGVAAPGAAVPAVVVSIAALESVGHLQEKVERMWGSPELDVFIRTLFMNSRDGERQGLPLEIAAELAFLAKLNRVIRALDAARRLSVSLDEAFRLIDEGDQSRFDESQRPVAEESLVFVSRRQEPPEGFFPRLWRILAESNFIIYLIVSMIAGILLWLGVR
jgi:hypothetical protein